MRSKIFQGYSYVHNFLFRQYWGPTRFLPIAVQKSGPQRSRCNLNPKPVVRLQGLHCPIPAAYFFIIFFINVVRCSVSFSRSRQISRLEVVNKFSWLFFFFNHLPLWVNRFIGRGDIKIQYASHRSYFLANWWKFEWLTYVILSPTTTAMWLEEIRKQINQPIISKILLINKKS